MPDNMSGSKGNMKVLFNGIVTEEGVVDINDVTDKNQYNHWARNYVIPVLGEDSFIAMNTLSKGLSDSDFEVGVMGGLYYAYWSRRLGFDNKRLNNLASIKIIDSVIPRN